MKFANGCAPFCRIWKLNYVHYTIDTFSGFQRAITLSFEKTGSIIMCLLEFMTIIGIPVQIKANNAPAYVSSKIKQYFHFIIKRILQVCHTIHRTSSCSSCLISPGFITQVDFQQQGLTINFCTVTKSNGKI